MDGVSVFNSGKDNINNQNEKEMLNKKSEKNPAKLRFPP